MDRSDRAFPRPASVADPCPSDLTDDDHDVRASAVHVGDMIVDDSGASLEERGRTDAQGTEEVVVDNGVNAPPSTGADGAATARVPHHLARSSLVLQDVTLGTLPITTHVDAAARQPADPAYHDQFHQSGYCWHPRSVRVVLDMDAATTSSSVVWGPYGIAPRRRVPLPATVGARALSEVAPRRRHVGRGHPIDAARDGDGDGRREQHWMVVNGYRRFFALLLVL